MKLLTPRQIRKLSRFVRERRPRLNVGRITERLGQAPDRLIVRAADGIDGCGGTLSYADCSAYRVTEAGALEAVDGLQVRVFNPSETDVPEDSFLLASRDRFGTWVVKQVWECPKWYCMEESEVGTGSSGICYPCENSHPECWLMRGFTLLSVSGDPADDFACSYHLGDQVLTRSGSVLLASPCSWFAGFVAPQAAVGTGSGAAAEQMWPQLILLSYNGAGAENTTANVPTNVWYLKFDMVYVVYEAPFSVERPWGTVYYTLDNTEWDCDGPNILQYHSTVLTGSDPAPSGLCGPWPSSVTVEGWACGSATV